MTGMRRAVLASVICGILGSGLGAGEAGALAAQADIQGRARTLLIPLYDVLDRAKAMRLLTQDDYSTFGENLERWVAAVGERRGPGPFGTSSTLSEEERQRLTRGLMEIARQVGTAVPYLMERLTTYESVFALHSDPERMNVMVLQLRDICRNVVDDRKLELWERALRGDGVVAEMELRSLEDQTACFRQMANFIAEMTELADAVDRKIDELEVLLHETERRCKAMTDETEKAECDKKATDMAGEQEVLIEAKNPPQRQRQTGKKDCGFLALKCVLKWGFGFLFTGHVVTAAILTGSGKPIEDWADAFISREEERWVEVDTGTSKVSVRIIGEDGNEPMDETAAQDLRDSNYKEIEYRNAVEGIRVSIWRNREEVRLFLGPQLRATFNDENTAVMSNTRGVDSVLDLRDISFEGDVFEEQVITTRAGQEVPTNRFFLRGLGVGPDGRDLRFTLSEAGERLGEFRLTVEGD